MKIENVICQKQETGVQFEPFGKSAYVTTIINNRFAASAAVHDETGNFTQRTQSGHASACEGGVSRSRPFRFGQSLNAKEKLPKSTMKRKYKLTIGPLIICGVLLSSIYGFAQGSLTPPGAPAPTMKSLDQIEPRTPISYEEYYIGSSGSYYVTTNLTGASAASPYGIWIASDNVSIDLNGFTVQGGSGSISGIYIYGSHTNITIRNGTVTGWGSDGVTFNYPYATPQNVILEHLTVSANGHVGIAIGNSSVVSDCVVQNSQAAGILCDGNGSRVVNNTLPGNNAGNNSNSGGIVLEGSNNLVDGNLVTGSGSAGYGIVFNIGGYNNNVIIRNSVAGNGSNNYTTAGGSGNDFGPVGTAGASTSPWANFSH